MSRRARVGRLGQRLGGDRYPPLVIVVQETDGRGVPPGPEAIEMVAEGPHGVRYVRRHRPHVIVVRERPDGPQ